MLDNAMSVVSCHRAPIRRRHGLMSALMPCGCILSLGVGLPLVTLVAGSLEVLGRGRIASMGR